MNFIEYAERDPLDIGPVRVTPFEVLHPSGAPPYALRLECEGKVLSFSGDTKWVDSLIAGGQRRRSIHHGMLRLQRAGAATT